MKKSQIFLLRHSKLKLEYASHADMPFSILSDLGTGKLNPTIDEAYTQKRISQLKDVVWLKNLTTIYVSPAQRCQDTADRLITFIKDIHGTTVQKITLDVLKEVSFDLEKIDTLFNLKKLLPKQGISLVNSAVHQSILTGVYCESLSEIYKRIDRIFETIRSLKQDGNTYIFLTHGFILNTLELYVRNKGRLATDISLKELEKTFNPAYLEGLSYSTRSNKITYLML